MVFRALANIRHTDSAQSSLKLLKGEYSMNGMCKDSFPVRSQIGSHESVAKPAEIIYRNVLPGDEKNEFTLEQDGLCSCYRRYFLFPL